VTDASHHDDAATQPYGIPAHAAADSQTPEAHSQPAHARRPRRRRRWPIVAGVTSAALLATGGAVVAHAHKTVTLDVDGVLTEVSTFAGSVERLLEGEGVVLAAHDLVTPGVDTALRDGAEVVVRLGREVAFEVDGETTTEWIAALDASDVLNALTGRGGDVRLVASRSGDRVELPIRFDAEQGDVAIVVDGETHTVAYRGQDASDLLTEAGVELAEQDLVSVVDVATAEIADAGAARVALVVQRVLTVEESHETTLPYERVEQRDANRFRDLRPAVRQEGVEGLHTRVYSVTTVDGVETARHLVSEETREPVDHVVAIGTRERPAPPPPPAAPAGGGGGGGGGGGDIPESVWVALAQCESGGRPSVVSPGGRFHGLYQFSVATWRSVGGTGLPSEASPSEQRARAVALQARSGWGQWPACSRRLGLR